MNSSLLRLLLKERKEMQIVEFEEDAAGSSDPIGISPLLLTFSAHDEIEEMFVVRTNSQRKVTVQQLTTIIYVLVFAAYVVVLLTEPVVTDAMRDVVMRVSLGGLIILLACNGYAVWMKRCAHVSSTTQEYSPRISRLIELVSVLMITFPASASAFTAYSVRRACFDMLQSRDYSKRPHTVRHACGAFIPPYFLFLLSLSVHLQVRFIWMFPMSVFIFILFVCGRQLNPTDTAPEMTNTFILVMCCFGYLLIVHHSFEEEQRNHFLGHLRLRDQVDSLKKQIAELQNYVNTLIPSTIRSRLLAGKRFIDHAKCGSYVVADINNFSTIARSSSLVTCAKIVARLHTFRRAVLEAAAVDGHTVHPAAVLGDSFYGSSNLVTPCPNHAVVCVTFAAELRRLFPLDFASEVEDAEHYQFLPRCAIATGPLLGTVNSTVYIRYDVLGPAQQDARKLIVSCEPHEIRISALTASRCEQFFPLSLENRTEGMSYFSVLDQSGACLIDFEVSSFALPDNVPTHSETQAVPVAPSIVEALAHGNMDSTTDFDEAAETREIAPQTDDQDDSTAQLDTEIISGAIVAATCGISESFADVKSEKCFRQHLWERRLRLSAVSSAFFSLFLMIMILGSLMESALGNDALRIAGVWLLTLDAGLFLLSAFAKMGMHFQFQSLGKVLMTPQIVAPNHSQRAAFIYFFFASDTLLFSLCFVGAALLRPTVPTNDLQYIYVMWLVHSVCLGPSLGIHICMVVFQYCVLASSHRLGEYYASKRVHYYVPLAMLLIPTWLGELQTRAHRQHFVELRELEVVGKKLARTNELWKGVLQATLPPGIQKLGIAAKGRVTIIEPHRDVALILMRFSPPCTWVPAPPTAECPGILQRSIGAVELRLSACDFIIASKIFGDEVLLISHSDKCYEKSAQYNTDDESGSSCHLCVMEAVELLQDVKMELQRKSEAGLRCPTYATGVAFGDFLSILISGEHLTYDVTGASFFTAKALVDAVPENACAVTDHFATATISSLRNPLLQYELKKNRQSRLAKRAKREMKGISVPDFYVGCDQFGPVVGLDITPPETWRVRGLGSVRVQLLKNLLYERGMARDVKTELNGALSPQELISFETV